MNTKMECELQSELCQLTMLIIILTLHIKKKLTNPISSPNPNFITTYSNIPYQYNQ